MLLMVGLVLLAQCCKPDDTCDDPTNPKCDNYDPCYSKPTTAGFKMRTTAPGFATPDNLQAEWCDTIFGSGVEFQADMQDAKSYTWFIGTETTPRSGYNFQVGFSSYTDDTLQNLSSENPDYYIPLPITLEVRNDPGQCVSPEDTLLSKTRYLVFSRKTLTVGTFRGYVEGENFTRDVTLWKNGEDPSNPNLYYRYFSDIIGLPYEDTLRFYGYVAGSIDLLSSYKKKKWDEALNYWWIATDGIKVWDQTITTYPDQPDRVDLHYERIPMDSSATEIVNFSGERIQ